MCDAIQLCIFVVSLEELFYSYALKKFINVPASAKTSSFIFHAFRFCYQLRVLLLISVYDIEGYWKCAFMQFIGFIKFLYSLC